MTALIDLYKTNHEGIVRWICKEYGINVDGGATASNAHRKRREDAARRLRLYRDQASVDVEIVIDQLYETEEYRRTLKKYVLVALEQNITRRIVDELASLYDRPALRILKKRQEEFRAEEKRIHLHEIAQESHRLVTLCNEVLLWMFIGADGLPKIRIVTPDTFDAIPNPNDSLVEAGFLLDMKPRTVLEGEQKNTLPHYEVWDDTYRYLINARGNLVDANGVMVSVPETHQKGRIPGVLLHRREPTIAILDGSHGSDIESAHLGVAMLNVMIMRLSKSQGERQPVLQGNLAAMATGQVMNGERPLLLPPEVVASMLETKTDPTHYLVVKKDKISNVAQTYGMSYEQFSISEGEQNASGGKGYQMRREKLTEIRLESRRRAVQNEALIVKLMGFDPEGMRVDFTEQAIPQDAVEELQLLALKLPLGLDSPIKYLRRKDPDLDDEQALDLMKENMSEWATMIVMVRALNMPADATGTNPGADPSINGSGRITQTISEMGLNGAPVSANPAPGAMAQTTRSRGVATAAQAGGATNG